MRFTSVRSGVRWQDHKTFGELISHFIVGLDEMCLMSDAFGDLHVIKAANKKKHEAMIADR